MDIKNYLIKLFKYNNHNKYHKYVNDWISNLTKEQLSYFKEEQRRIELYNLKGY